MEALPKELKLKTYPSRKCVADAALAARQPFSMKQLLLYLKRIQAVTSKATAYRTITLLIENKLLREPLLFQGEWIYFPATRENELVWVCTDCRKACAMPSSSVNYFLREHAGHHGMYPDELSLHVQSSCLNRNKCMNHQNEDDELSSIWPVAGG
ncbi:MAG: hypothetical protein ABIP97_08880 [Chthoniobacterales bacterium]